MSNRGFTNVIFDQVSPSQPLARALILLFGEFERELIAELSKQVPRSKVTPADHHILRNIKPEGSSIVEIAKLSGVSKQAASKAISSLQKRGLVTKSPHVSDARAYLVSFTPKGLHLVQIAIEIISNIEMRYQNLIGAKELQRIKAWLKILFDDHVTNQRAGKS